MSEAGEKFWEWWNRNWPSVQPTHETLHAYLAGWITGCDGTAARAIEFAVRSLSEGEVDADVEARIRQTQCDFVAKFVLKKNE